MIETENMEFGRRFILVGAMLVMAGLLTGLVSGNLANPRMGLSAHLAGMMGGTLLLALGAGWHHVRLAKSAERWAFGLLAFGNVANWATVLLAAVLGAGRSMMPIAAGDYGGSAWQENLVGILLIALSLALIAGFALVIKGLLPKSK